MNIVYDAVIVGGGIGGLAAAEYLHSLNYNVLVLESTHRIGGRIFTYRSKDSYFERGAFSFADNEEPLYACIQRFALPIIEQTSIERVFRFKNYAGSVNERAPFLKDKEREIPLCELMNYFCGKLEEIPRDLSLAEALSSIGASEEAIEWLQTNTFIGLLGKFPNVSTRAALTFLKQYDSSKTSYVLKGGNDQLPHAFAERVKKQIRYNHRVLKVEQLKDLCLIQGESFIFEAKKIIFAIPLHELRRIEINPPLSSQKQQVIQSVFYTKCARISIIAPPAALPRGGVFLVSDRLGWFRDLSAFQTDPNKKTVITISAAGAQAERLAASFDGWKKEIDEELSTLSSNWDPSKAKYDMHVWEEAYSCFLPNTFEQQKYLQEPEGNFHFAGEHDSPKFASINGALASGLEAARQVSKDLANSN